jgi:preprotein translocase subunit SecE
MQTQSRFDAVARPREYEGRRTNDVKRIRRYFDEVWSELKKVSWPTREQVRNLTVLVFAISLVIGLYITVLDRVLVGVLSIVTPPAAAT